MLFPVGTVVIRDAEIVKAYPDYNLYTLKILLDMEIVDPGGFNVGIKGLVIALAEKSKYGSIRSGSIGWVNIFGERRNWWIKIPNFYPVGYLNVTREVVRILEGGRRIKLSGSFVPMEEGPPEYEWIQTWPKDWLLEVIKRLYVFVLVRDADLNEVALIVPVPSAEELRPSFSMVKDGIGNLKVHLPSPELWGCTGVTFMVENGRILFPIRHEGSIAVCPFLPWFIMVVECGDEVILVLMTDIVLTSFALSVFTLIALRARGMRLGLREWLRLLPRVYIIFFGVLCIV